MSQNGPNRDRPANGDGAAGTTSGRGDKKKDRPWKHDSSSLVVYSDGNASVTEFSLPLALPDLGDRDSVWLVYDDLPPSTHEEGMSLKLLSEDGGGRFEGARVVGMSFPRGANGANGVEVWRLWAEDKTATVSLAPDSEVGKGETATGVIIHLAPDNSGVTLDVPGKDDGGPGSIVRHNRRVTSVRVHKDPSSVHRDEGVKGDRRVSCALSNPSEEFVPHKRVVFEVRARGDGARRGRAVLMLSYRVSGLLPSIEYNVTVDNPTTMPDATMDYECQLCVINRQRARFSNCRMRFVHGEIRTIPGPYGGAAFPVVMAEPQQAYLAERGGPETTMAMMPQESLKKGWNDARKGQPTRHKGGWGGIPGPDHFVSCEVKGYHDLDEDSLGQKFRAFGEEGMACSLEHVCDTEWDDSSVFFVLSLDYKGSRVLAPGLFRVMDGDGELLGDVSMGMIEPGKEYEMRLNRTYRVTARRSAKESWEDKKDKSRTNLVYQHQAYRLRLHNLLSDDPIVLKFVEHLESETQKIEVKAGGGATSAPAPSFERREKVPNSDEKDFTSHVLSVRLGPGEKRNVNYVISTPLATTP